MSCVSLFNKIHGTTGGSDCEATGRSGQHIYFFLSVLLFLKRGILVVIRVEKETDETEMRLKKIEREGQGRSRASLHVSYFLS